MSRHDIDLKTCSREELVSKVENQRIEINNLLGFNEKVVHVISGKYQTEGWSEIDYQNGLVRLRVALLRVWDAGFSFACQNSCAGMRDDDKTDYRQRDIDAILGDESDNSVAISEPNGEEAERERQTQLRIKTYEKRIPMSRVLIEADVCIGLLVSCAKNGETWKPEYQDALDAYKDARAALTHTPATEEHNYAPEEVARLIDADDFPTPTPGVDEDEE